MAVQNVGSFGGTTTQPTPAQGNPPRAAALPRDSVVADVVSQAMPSSEQQQPSREQISQAIENMRKSVGESASNNLQFSIDDDTGRTLVRVTDRQTGELIRQIPSEEMVALAKSLDRMQGMLLRQQA